MKNLSVYFHRKEFQLMMQLEDFASHTNVYSSSSFLVVRSLLKTETTVQKFESRRCQFLFKRNSVQGNKVKFQ